MDSTESKQAVSLELPKPSLWARYLNERQGKHVLEYGAGFIIYVFLQEHCYIEDIYVVPEGRKHYIASGMADEVAKIALAAGYKKLLGTVKPTAKGSTVSMKALLGYGFEILSAADDAIYLEKQIS